MKQSSVMIYLTSPLYPSNCEDRTVNNSEGSLLTKHNGTRTAAILTFWTFSVVPGIFHTGFKSAIPGLIGRNRELHRFLWEAVKMSSTIDKLPYCFVIFLMYAKLNSFIQLKYIIIYRLNRAYNAIMTCTIVLKVFLKLFTWNRKPM